jgi:polar amino acid transport system substrate-binding protein
MSERILSPAKAIANDERLSSICPGCHTVSGTAVTIGKALMRSIRSHFMAVTGILLGLSILGCDGSATAPSNSTLPATAAETRQGFAPTGRLRVALQLANPLNVVQDTASGGMLGVGFDLGNELALRLGVPFEPVFYPSVGALLGGAGAWDVAFIGFSAARAQDWDFTGLHVEVEFGYLVPRGSAISAMAEVDRAGVRLAVQQNSGPDAFFTGTLRNVVLVRAPTNPAALEAVQTGAADVMGSIKPVLFELAPQLPGSRVLDGHPGIDPHAMAMPKGRGERIQTYARQYIENAKAEGRVQAAIERAGIGGVSVAPLQ